MLLPSQIDSHVRLPLDAKFQLLCSSESKSPAVDRQTDIHTYIHTDRYTELRAPPGNFGRTRYGGYAIRNPPLTTSVANIVPTATFNKLEVRSKSTVTDWSVFQSGRSHRHRLQRPLVVLAVKIQLQRAMFRLLDDAGDRLVRVPIQQISPPSSSAASSYPACKVSAPASQVSASRRRR
jgi:hypothetical protein